MKLWSALGRSLVKKCRERAQQIGKFNHSPKVQQLKHLVTDIMKDAMDEEPMLVTPKNARSRLAACLVPTR